MKKALIILSTMLVAAGMFYSCQKPDDGKKEEEKTDKAPTLTIAADATFNADMKANITLTLSAAAAKDIEVKLAKADVQNGKTEIAADFTKKVTIAAGETTKTVEVTADAMGLESGEYQAAIKVASAEGAEVAANAVVYINYTYVFNPAVNIYADAQFKSDKTAKARVVLEKATTADVKVKLVADAESKAEVTFPAEVVIPAGTTEKEIELTVTVPGNIEPGIYPFILKLGDIENGVAGKANEVTINLAYPFAVAIEIDGVFDDWNDPAIITYTNPDGALFKDVYEMKLAGSGKYVYMYLKFKDKGFDTGYPIDIFINADGDDATGCYLHTINNDGTYAFIKPWNNPGIEWYLEGSLQSTEDFYDLTGLTYYLKYTGDDGNGFWAGGFANLTADLCGDASKIYAQGALNGEVGEIEVQFLRSAFLMTGAKAGFGFKLMDGMNNWDALGLIPQVASPSAPTFTAADGLVMVYLPAYAE